MPDLHSSFCGKETRYTNLKLSQWNSIQGICPVFTLLVHLSPVHPFSTPWKHQKTIGSKWVNMLLGSVLCTIDFQNFDKSYNWLVQLPNAIKLTSVILHLHIWKRKIVIKNQKSERFLNILKFKMSLNCCLVKSSSNVLSYWENLLYAVVKDTT